MWSWCGNGRIRTVPARLVAAVALAVVVALMVGAGLAATSTAHGPHASPTVTGSFSGALEDCDCCYVVCPQSKAVSAAGGGERAWLPPPPTRPDDARRPTGWSLRIDPPPPKPV